MLQTVKETVGRLRKLRLFYLVYPQFSKIIPSFIDKYFDSKGQSAIGSFKDIENKKLIIGQSAIVQFDEPDKNHLTINVEKLLTKLSFTHLVQLLPIDEPVKRSFYELECIKGTWSVRELKRQIDSLYFERCGMSKNPDKLSKIIQATVEKQTHSDFMRTGIAMNNSC